MKLGGTGIVIEEDSSASSSDEKSKGEKSSKSVQKKISRTTSQVIFVINTLNTRLSFIKT